MPADDSDQALARRWKDRVRFVINDQAEFQAEWRSPALIPADLKPAFDEEIRASGPSLSALRHLETAITKHTGDLAPALRKISAQKISAQLDRLGFRSFAS